MKKLITALSLTGLLCAYASALPRDEKTQCQRAKDALERVDVHQKPRWSMQMYEIFEGSRDCLTGELGDDYSTKLARFIIQDPEGIPAMMRLMTDDRSFQAAVLSRITSNISNNDLKHIARNADTYCPPKAYKSCQALSAKAHTELKAQDSLTEQPEALTPKPPPGEHFSSFWVRFKTAALADDFTTLAGFTRFPFVDKRIVPGGKPIHYSKASFIEMGSRFLNADAGNGVSTMRQLISSKFPEDFNYLESEDHIQIGTFEFDKSPSGWQFTAVHLSS